MKFYFSEARHNYSNYLFPYQVLLLQENENEIEKIYEMGFLPFRNHPDLFYLSRSSRCNLSRFELSSENRRIVKKTSLFQLKKINMVDFKYSPRVQKSCKVWAKKRNWKISIKSLKAIFGGKFFNSVWVWRDDNEIVGYQIIFENKKIIHTAHVFYNSDLATKDLAMRMLIEASSWAKEEKKQYHYLGTSYGKTGFYKRNLAGFEFFNGFRWSNNLEELKYFNEREEINYLLRERAYLDTFWEGKLEKVLKTTGISIKQ